MLQKTDAVTKKQPRKEDKHIGARVRLRRMQLAMSQEKLGDAIGLTFQQVQKYEKGANRIGGSRLHQLAAILQVPVQYFFEGLTGMGSPPLQPDYVAETLATPNGLAMVKAMSNIKDVKVQNKLVALAEALGNAP